MLTNKGYIIPKYLYRRKIELIREKIIKRKYGYLFFRKTLSNILPSQAQNHYKKRLRKKYFKRWTFYWYMETMEWKLTLRAEIHYNLSLQQRFLRRWKLFHIQQKSNRIKQQIAVMYHRNNNTKLCKRFYLSKWKHYIKYRREKKRKLQLARNFFKSKYKPEMLCSYYKRWKIFTKAAKKIALKLYNADKFFEKKLAAKMLKELQKYAKENIEKRIILSKAVNFYKKKLLKKALIIWLIYIKRKHQEDQDSLLAQTHYCFKLKVNYFRRLLKNKNRNQFIRYVLAVASEQQSQRIIMRCFNKLKKYVQYRQSKKQKTLNAILHYGKRLKKKSLGRWNQYLWYCREERKSQQLLLEMVICKLNKYVLRKCFTKWEKFKTHNVHKKLKQLNAANYHRKYVLRETFKIWRFFTSYKKSRRKMKIEAKDYHNNRMKNRSIVMWKSFMQEEKNFKQKLFDAKSYYRQKIINEGLLVIMKAGLQKKEEKLSKCRDKIFRQLFLAQKYASIWKQNVFFKNIGDETSTNKFPFDESFEENKENVPRASNLEWYQICFLTPRLPNTYANLANSS